MKPETDKLLSHRLRGFARVEHTREGLLAACGSQVPYLEIDTRVSQDGEIYVSHDNDTRRFADQDLTFSGSPSALLNRVVTRTAGSLLTLRETLEVFQKRARQEQRLALDIKDCGFEVVHLALVREFGLEERIVFVSWIPQTLLKLRALGTPAPLILSHWNLIRLGLSGRILSRWFDRRLFRVSSFVLMGGRRVDDPLSGMAHGFQHALFCRELPGPVVEALASSGGGICVHRSALSQSLGHYCQQSGLKLWVFAAKSPGEFLRYAGLPYVDVVFSDDAPGALEVLRT